MKKRLKRPASILLALCLLAALLPQRALAAETIIVPAGGDLAQAVEDAALGSTLVLQGDSYLVEPEGSGDDPWVIDKDLTIQGGGGTINVRRGGIVLKDNVTFENVVIGFSSNMRNAIIANGHTLTLDGVTCSQNSAYPINLFCGGLLDSNNEGFGNYLPASGSTGTVIVRGNTNY